MLPRSDDALAAVQRGHVRTASVVLHDWSIGSAVPLPIAAGGSVALSWDDDGKVRRGGSISAPGFQWPTAAAPITSYVTIRITIDGTEVFDLGQFAIAATSTARPGGAVELTLGDWAGRAERAKIREDSVQGPYSLNTHIQSLLSAPGPWTTIVTRSDAADGGAAFPLALTRGQTYFEAAASACARFGCVPVYVSSTSIEIRDYDRQTSPVESIPDRVLIDRRTGMDATNGFINRVRVTIEDSATHVRYTADRRIEAGPFKWDRRGIGWADDIGQVEQVEGATQAMADSLAAKAFAQRAGLVREAPLTIVPMPWLQAGDLVALPKSPTGVVEQFLIRSITIPLSPDGTTQITTRDRTLWPDGGGTHGF